MASIVSDQIYKIIYEDYYVSGYRSVLEETHVFSVSLEAA